MTKVLITDPIDQSGIDILSQVAQVDQKIGISDADLAEIIKDYGSKNELRLTGLHETQSIKKFSYGVSDRGASIRIPIKTHLDQKGYLEDRRPASNADPYNVSRVILENII